MPTQRHQLIYNENISEAKASAATTWDKALEQAVCKGTWSPLLEGKVAFSSYFSLSLSGNRMHSPYATLSHPSLPHRSKILSRALAPLPSPWCEQHGLQGDTGHPLLHPVSSHGGSWARVYPGTHRQTPCVTLCITPRWGEWTSQIHGSHPGRGWRWLDSCSTKVISLYDCMEIIPFSLC